MDQNELLKILDERLDGLTRVRRKQFVTLDDFPLLRALSGFYEERDLKPRNFKDLMSAMPVDMMSITLQSIRDEVATARPKVDPQEVRRVQEVASSQDDVFRKTLLSEFANLNSAIKSIRHSTARPSPHAAPRRSRKSYTSQSQKTDRFILSQQKAKVCPKDLIAALDNSGHPLPNSVTWGNKKSWTDAYMSNRSAVEKYMREASKRLATKAREATVSAKRVSA